VLGRILAVGVADGRGSATVSIRSSNNTRHR
jgi:hypothetical protein